MAVPHIAFSQRSNPTGTAPPDCRHLGAATLLFFGKYTNDAGN
jgi:hypothetical protein